MIVAKVIGYVIFAGAMIVLVGAARASWPDLREAWRELWNDV